MKPIHIAFFIFTIVFVSLFIISVPFPYYVIPDVGNYIAPYFEAIIRYVGVFVLRLDRSSVYDIISDSTGMYIHAALLFIVSILVALISYFISPLATHKQRCYYELYVRGISYYVSLQLLIYGFDKLFKHQFYLPEPNILYTPLGHLSKDILYWSTIGSSYSYSVFSGVIEIIAAIFLLFKSTRKLAALLAMGIMIHVMVINFGFDISVKVYTCFLLYLTILLSYPTIKKMVVLFVLNKPVDIEKNELAHPTNSKKIVYYLCKALVIGCLFWEGLYVHVVTHNFNDDKAPRPFLHGAYNVECMIKNGDTLTPVLSNKEYIKRIFIHREGYLITQLMNDEMQDYKLEYDTAHQFLTLSSPDMTSLKVHYKQTTKDSILILKTKIGNDSTTIITKLIDISKLPLMQPYFHWTADEY